jgi:GR25 family glycosyltransferase involved in LPS biosynthesis
MKQIFLLCIISLLGCPSWLSAHLQDHLKKFDSSSDAHRMRNIDFIYLINLDQRPEKLQMSLSQLEPFGIHPYRFSAVNGWELTLEEINDVGLKYSPEMEGGCMATSYRLDGHFEPSHEVMLNYGQTYFCHCMSRGAIGIVLSHLCILQNAYDAGFETIWVMEDDIQVMEDPRVLSDLIEKLDDAVGKENWDILFTDRDIRDRDGYPKACYWAAKRPDFGAFSRANDYAMRTLVSPNFIRIGARWGAHSMIVRRSGMKKLLQFFKAHQIFFPYDMDFIFPIGIKLYTVIEDVVSNLPTASSDNGGPNYLTQDNK